MLAWLPDASSTAGGRDDRYPDTTAPPLETTAFDELGGSFRGELLLPTSPGYDTARRIWNGAIDRRPACIARCSGRRRRGRGGALRARPRPGDRRTGRGPQRGRHRGVRRRDRHRPLGDAGRVGRPRRPHGPGAGWCSVGRRRPRDAGPRSGHHRRHRGPHRRRRAHPRRRHRLPHAQTRAHRRQPARRRGGHRRGQHRPGVRRRTPRSVLGAARRRRQLRRRHLVPVRVCTPSARP